MLKTEDPQRGLSMLTMSDDHTSENAELGGAERDRTVDPLLAKQVLSQLSYSPTISSIPE